MEELLSHLETIPQSAVPAQCLMIADYLDGRGVDGIGWRALGLLRKQPVGSEDYPGRWYWTFRDATRRRILNASVDWSIYGNLGGPWTVRTVTRADVDKGRTRRGRGSWWHDAWWLSRASALSCAARSFTELPTRFQTDLLQRSL